MTQPDSPPSSQPPSELDSAAALPPDEPGVTPVADGDDDLDGTAIVDGQGVLLALQKVLQVRRAGGRDEVRAWIGAGRVAVEGVVCTRFAERVPVDATITLDGAPVPTQPPVVLLMHKPKKHLTTLHDPGGLPSLGGYLPADAPPLFLVGRLDFNSEGALLVTNDGQLARRILHPEAGMLKRYGVKIRDRIAADDPRLRVFTEGIVQGGVQYRAVEVRFRELRTRATWIDVWLNEGKNREVRRLCAAAGFQVVKLRRESIGPIELGALNPRVVRPLTPDEMEALYAAAGLPAPGQALPPARTEAPEA